MRRFSHLGPRGERSRAETSYAFNHIDHGVLEVASTEGEAEKAAQRNHQILSSRLSKPWRLALHALADSRLEHPRGYVEVKLHKETQDQHRGLFGPYYRADLDYLD
jgi:hypothetical protein